MYNKLYSIVCLIQPVVPVVNMIEICNSTRHKKTLWAYCSVIVSLHNLIALFNKSMKLQMELNHEISPVEKFLWCFTTVVTNCYSFVLTL